jgi:hypothetical protein
LVLFGLLLGIAAAEIITRYWKSRYPNPPRVYAFNRRIHHGEVGALLLLSSLFLRLNPAANVAAILTGIGLTLIKDDRADIADWFKVKEIEAVVIVDDKNEREEELESMKKEIRNLIDIQEEQIELEIKRSSLIVAC